MSNQGHNQYFPDVVSPPGETLRETLEALGMSQAELAERMGRPKKTINEIIKGKAALMPDTALQISRMTVWLWADRFVRDGVPGLLRDASRPGRRKHITPEKIQAVVEATLTTRPVKFSGRHLFVNLAAPQGELRAEVLDKNGNVIAPFTRENCIAASGDKTLLKLSWKDGGDLSKLAGQPVRFRFHLTNGALYSFWVSPAKNGASFGYVAAGGPGYPGPVDNVSDAK